MERKNQTASVKRNGVKQHCASTPVTEKQLVTAMGRIVRRVRRMPHKQLVQSLKDAGILTAAGKLASNYR
jgi:hypothetical protein